MWPGFDRKERGKKRKEERHEGGEGRDVPAHASQGMHMHEENNYLVSYVK
jgi:hypothetical protein